MKKYNPTPLSWLYNQLLTKPDLTIYECTEALDNSKRYAMIWKLYFFYPG
jgi:hypothetical protein